LAVKAIARIAMIANLAGIDSTAPAICMAILAIFLMPHFIR
jgi:hypothetical protein